MKSKHLKLKTLIIACFFVINCGDSDTISAEMTINDIDTYQEIVPPLYMAYYMSSAAISNLDESDISQARKIMTSRVDWLTRSSLKHLSDGSPTTENMDVNETLNCSNGGFVTTTGSITVEAIDYTLEMVFDLSVNLENCSADFIYYEDETQEVAVCSEEVVVDGMVRYSGRETYAVVYPSRLVMQTMDTSLTTDSITAYRNSGDVELAFDVFFDNYNTSSYTFEASGSVRFEGMEYAVDDIEALDEQTNAADFCSEI